MAAEMNTNKRRRKEGIQLLDLPDNAVAHVATYLSNISRALFAIGSPSASKLTILSSDAELWETLDFNDIDWSLARRLKDDGLEDILTITDAVNNTKCIKLTGCININGSGLTPLRRSVVLKQLDLSLVGQYKSPKLDSEPLISKELVLPILTSMINAEGTSLKHLQLPQKWRMNTERDTPLTDFLTTYNNHLARRQSKCKACDRSVNRVNRVHVISRGDYFGIQNYICYTCLESFCDACNEEDGHGRRMLSFCNNCMKDYCVNCNEMKVCDNCGETHCIKCDCVKSCQSCDNDFCPECGPCSDDIKECDTCYRVEDIDKLCSECAPTTYQCKWVGCEATFCEDCEKLHLLSHAQGDVAKSIFQAEAL